MDRWRGKVAVVTGASSGIGQAIVRELLKHDVKVVALARRPHLVDALKNELTLEQSNNLHSFDLDITCEEDVKKTFQNIKSLYTSIHIVVNNAGVFTKGSLIDGPVENWRKTWDVNVMGLCTVTKEALNLMVATGVNDGHIIHINSLAGHKVPDPTHLDPSTPVGLNVYPATKHAVTALAQVIRIEIRSRNLQTKVTSLSPGLVRTDIFKANDVDPDGHVYALPCLEPSEVAEAAIYALSTPPSVNITELTIQHVSEMF